MNLKGDRSTITKSGAMSFTSRNNNYGGTTAQDGTVLTSISVTASSGWSGTSESKGSGTSINILNPYKVAYCFIRLS